MRRFPILQLLFLMFAALCLCGPSRAASPSRHELLDAGFHLVAGSPLPVEVVLHGSASDLTLGRALGGRPALLVFTDYRCQSLCGVILDQLADTLPNVPLALGRDYNVISLALDASQTAADAARFRDVHAGGGSLRRDGLFLANDAPALRALQASVGLVAPYDAVHKQFAHPAGLVLVDAKGRAQRILSPFALDPFDLKLALTETGAAPLSLTGHALLLCYGWNPAAGLYTLRVERVLGIAAAATVLLMGAAIAWFLLGERRRSTRSFRPNLTDP